MGACRPSERESVNISGTSEGHPGGPSVCDVQRALLPSTDELKRAEERSGHTHPQPQSEPPGARPGASLLTSLGSGLPCDAAVLCDFLLLF